MSELKEKILAIMEKNSKVSVACLLYTSSTFNSN